jgi:hypothetical protein
VPSLHETLCGAVVGAAPCAASLAALLPPPAQSYPAAGWLLGNLVEAAAAGVRCAPAGSAQLFAALAQALLAAAPRRMLPPPPLDADSDDDEGSDGEADMEQPGAAASLRRGSSTPSRCASPQRALNITQRALSITQRHTCPSRRAMAGAIRLFGSW